MKIVECVPNFSEGRNRSVIKSITDAIESVQGATLLDVDPGAGANRTVVTFVGDPVAVSQAAFLAIARAAELIDMSAHRGSHPRMGATDVCPFVPVSGVTTEECVEMARALGRRVASELGIPVYLYEDAASSDGRRNLADIRAGEYEGLERKLADPAWRPDFGEPVFNARSGATVIGVRPFLIAFNVNLNSDRREDARELALSLRERGRFRRDADGLKVPDGKGGFERVQGILERCKAVGWVIPEYGRAQVSMNLTDHRVTGMHRAFEATDELARGRGLRVTGSEIVGLVPADAVVESGRHFLARRGACRGVPARKAIDCAVQSMGLADVAPFDPAQRVLELRLAPRGLVSMDLDTFSAELSTDSPAPGGGSVAALAGALCASLVSMVANLSFAKKKDPALRGEMERVALDAQRLREGLLSAVDRDTGAFNLVMEALRLPHATDEQAAARADAVARAVMGATTVPLEVMQMGVEALELVLVVVHKGSRGSITDAGVGGLVGRACVAGARMNVLVNLKGLADGEFSSAARSRSSELMRRADELGVAIEEALEKHLA